MASQTKTPWIWKQHQIQTCWVVLGIHKIHGIDTDKTYPSVVKASTMNVSFSLCAEEDLEMQKLDISTGFIDG